MTLSCREQLVAAIFAIVEAATDLPAERNRKVALQGPEDEGGGDLPRAILFEGDEVETDAFTGEDAFELPLLIQVAIDQVGAGAATTCNDIRARLRQALMADRTVGGLARDLVVTDPGNWIGVDVEAENFEGFMLGLTARYATAENDPFTFSN